MKQATSTVVAEELDHLTEHGWVIIEEALNDETVLRYRAACERLFREDTGILNNHRPWMPDVFYVELLPAKDPLFEDFFLNPRVLPLAYETLGDDFTANELWALGIAPGGFTAEENPLPGAYHCDKPVCIPGYTLSLQLCFPLVDVRAENGATRIVPGSHMSGRHPDTGLVHHPDEIYLEASAGSCIAFYSHLWHSASANTTEDEIRTTLFAQFQRPWIKSYIDFARALPPEILARATPEARRIYGLGRATVPFTERWMWDLDAGRPKPEFRDQLKARYGEDCCLSW